MGSAWRHPNRGPLSVDKTIFCTTKNSNYGIPLIVEELKKYAFKATFFTELFFSYCLGPDQAQMVVDYLLTNGQDVQLHLHPVFRNHSRAIKEGTPDAFRQYRALGDALTGRDLETQYELLAEGAELFRRFVGQPPVAFRAGGFLGDHNTLAALRRVAIPIDSSYNPSVAQSFPRGRPKPNIVQRIDGTIEMPLTTAMSGFDRFRGWKPMAISSVSLAELITALTQARAAGLGHVVLIFHSFSTVKPRDVYYSSMRPDWIVISRFRRLLKYLADQGDKFEISTFGEAACDLERFDVEQPVPHLELGLVKPLLRKGLQVVNRVYWI
jgi:peptidoglycan/xylan/chitin deacetylase (PgdA/CDA1 family)